MIMKEVNRITKLLQDLYNGSPWIDVNISAVLENISANQAGKKYLHNGIRSGKLLITL